MKRTLARYLGVVCIASGIAFAFPVSAQQIGTYPTTAVELEPGIFVCDSEASLLHVLKERSVAILHQSSFELPADCGELLPGIKGQIRYVRAYEDSVLRTDVVEYKLFRTLLPGINLPLGTLYGFGETDFKIIFDPTLPMYHI